MAADHISHLSHYSLGKLLSHVSEHVHEQDGHPRVRVHSKWGEPVGEDMILRGITDHVTRPSARIRITSMVEWFIPFPHVQHIDRGSDGVLVVTVNGDNIADATPVA